MTQAMYADTKAALEEVNRLPDEARLAILTMLRGAVIISDMYGLNETWTTARERSTVSRAAAQSSA